MGRNRIVQKTNNSYLSIYLVMLYHMEKTISSKECGLVVSLNFYIFFSVNTAKTRAHIPNAFAENPRPYRIVAQMCGDKFSIPFFLHLSSVERV